MKINERVVNTDNMGFVEASRYAQRFPAGFHEVRMAEATHIAWFGSALRFYVDESQVIDIYVGMDCDRVVKVRLCDIDVFGFLFIAKVPQ